MKRAEQRQKQGYPAFRNAIDTNNLEPNIGVTEFTGVKKQISTDKQQIISKAVIEGQGDKDDAEISLPLDVDDFSDSVSMANAAKFAMINKLDEHLGAPEKG